MTTNLVIAAAIYLIIFPALFWGVGFADKKFKQKRAQKLAMNKSVSRAELTKNQPVPAMPKWKERLKYTRSDKRQFVIQLSKKKEPKVFPVSRRQAYWLIRGIGLLVALVAGLLGIWSLLALAALLYFGGIVYGYKSADSIMLKREKMLKKMFSIARSKLGQSAEYENNPGAVIRVIEWRDELTPQKIEFDLPDTFGEEQAEGFMKLFNQNFGGVTAWVPSDNPETHEPGWNFTEGLVTINAVPPLPQSAPWDEHYVLTEGVAWSFFPIGLGVENGLELPNPKTGEVENVLGFDLSGEQAKMASKYGLKMSQTITTSPMVLVGGGTGGGKALAVDTVIKTFSEEEAKALLLQSERYS